MILDLKALRERKGLTREEMVQTLNLFQELAKAPVDLRESYAQELLRLRSKIGRKGRLAFIGRPDAGKSRTINTLLGEDILPVGWTPMTSAFILIKSAHDRPEYMDFATVYVAKEGSGAAVASFGLASGPGGEDGG